MAERSMVTGMDTREIVLDILLELEREQEYVNILLAYVLEKYDYLDGREKAFIKRVSEGTVERRIQIDHVLDLFSKVKTQKMKPLIRALLRMSVYQILFMEHIPDAAVCNEAVKLAKKRKFQSLQGYVNGVLRAVVRGKDDIAYPDRQKEPDAFWSVCYSVPVWLAAHLRSVYGAEHCERILESFLTRKPVCVRLQETLSVQERERLMEMWRQDGVTVKKHPYLPYAATVEKSEGIQNLEGYREGAFAVQDVSSMLVVEAAGIRAGDTVLDVCAAPGGKALHAAAKLAGTGQVIACDLTEYKTARIEENRERMRADNLSVRLQDARIMDEALRGSADVLIVDVPCSGLGVIGRKQDIKYRVSEQSLSEIVTLQKEIVSNVVQYLKADGTMMYSTCTMNPAENEEMVRWICRTFSMETVSMAEELPAALKAAGETGCVQLLPGVHPTDGFFFAKLRRRVKDIKSLTLMQLQEEMESLGEKPFRAGQLYAWMHEKLAEGYEEMTNIPRGLAQKCAERYRYTVLEMVTVQESKIDGTRKYLFRLPDGNTVESVWMRYRHGNSVCISSQVGCRMGCRFCASTLDGLERNLLPSEMLEQIYAITRHTGERVSNVVVMGTGEPMDNFDNLLQFITLLTDENGLHISQRNITVSTCGLVPEMRRLAERKLQITLALSLHAATDEKRRKLMPVAERYCLRELLDTCAYYFEQTGRRITFEYSLVKGVNDTSEDAAQLTALIRGLNCHVNLIPVNPVKEREYVQSERRAVEAFRSRLEKSGIQVTVRREMGRDIDGACGQLRRRYL